MTLGLRFATLSAALALAAPALAQEAAAPPAAVPPPAETPAPSSPPASVPAGTTVDADASMGSPPAGMGQIVFFRPGAVGPLLGCTVREGDTTLSKLRVHRYFVRNVEPGVHTYMVESEAKDLLKLEVEAGETYFVKCNINMGIIVGRPNLSPSDKAAFDKDSKKLKPQDPA